MTHLLKQANCPNPAERRAAVTGLGTIASRPFLTPEQAEDIAAAVIAAANDTDPTVRARAVRGLGRLPAARVTATLTMLVSDDHHATREAAVRTLVRLDPTAAAPALVSAAAHQDYSVRVAALTGLRWLPTLDETVWVVLIAALSDEHPGIQGTAMTGLLSLAARSAQMSPAVIRLARDGLGSSSPPRREISLELLHRLGVPGHRDRCLAALTDVHPRVRQRAARSLENARDQDGT